MLPGAGQFPMPAAIDDKLAARMGLLFGVIYGKQLDFGFTGQFTGGARNELEGQTIVVQRDFVSGNAFSFSHRVPFDKWRVAPQPREIRLAHDYPTEFCLSADKF